MKTVKRTLSIVLLLTFILSTVSFAVTSSGYGSTVTMYAPDGRSIVVSVYEVPNWKAVGWYDYPVTTMYAPDGRQMVIYTGDVPSWKAVGWYDYPVTTMYAPDGRQMVVYTGDVPSWKAVGWYDYPIGSNTGINSGSYYYPNSVVPDYTSVTGIGLSDTYYGDKVTIYIYPNTKYGEFYEAVDYMDCLQRNYGWSEWSEESDDEKISWYYIKHNNMVGVTYQAEYDEIWISVGPPF